MRQGVCLSGRCPVPLCSGAEQKGYTRVETRKAHLGAKSTGVVARTARLEPSRKLHRRCTKFNSCSTLGSPMDLCQEWNDGYSNELTNMELESWT